MEICKVKMVIKEWAEKSSENYKMKLFLYCLPLNMMDDKLR